VNGTVRSSRKLIEILRSCWIVLFARRRLLIYLNVLFFGILFVSALSTNLLFAAPINVSSGPATPVSVRGLSWPVMFLTIFLVNLAVSAFLYVTLGGLVFFPFSACVLVYWAIDWGARVSYIPGWTFLGDLPTLVLEGEAYVLACMAGTLVGVSWLKPNWFSASELLSRRAALKKAFKEGLRTYLFVTLFLIAAAAVETATIIMRS
jgi:hypothetical protein